MTVCDLIERRMKTDIFQTGSQLVAQSGGPRQGLARFIHYAIEAHQPHRGFHREVPAMAVLDQDVASMVKDREARVRRELLAFFESFRESLQTDDLEAAVKLVHMTVEAAAHRTLIFKPTTEKERLMAN